MQSLGLPLAPGISIAPDLDSESELIDPDVVLPCQVSQTVDGNLNGANGSNGNGPNGPGHCDPLSEDYFKV